MRWMWLCGWNIIVAGEVEKIASIKRLDSFNTHYFQVFYLGMREYKWYFSPFTTTFLHDKFVNLDEQMLYSTYTDI